MFCISVNYAVPVLMTYCILHFHYSFLFQYTSHFLFSFIVLYMPLTFSLFLSHLHFFPPVIPHLLNSLFDNCICFVFDNRSHFQHSYFLFSFVVSYMPLTFSLFLCHLHFPPFYPRFAFLFFLTAVFVSVLSPNHIFSAVLQIPAVLPTSSSWTEETAWELP